MPFNPVEMDVKGTIRLEDIIDKMAAYNPQADLEIVRKAYIFSALVHQGQTRVSGEPYLTHPINVAYILAELKMDPQCVATGLLHDTIEDTHTTPERIAETFGKEIAALVDGVTKISRITFEKKEDREAENFRKMLIAMSKDIRVLIVKLADRLHNMRTLGALAPDKRRKIAQETIDIYAPLANRLGIGWMKAELEEYSFMHLEPERYTWLREKMAKEQELWRTHIEHVKSVIAGKLAEHSIQGEVAGRLKHIFGVHKKMVTQDVDFDNIHDIIAFRVIVKTVAECYSVLGMVHSLWKPVPGRFKDYIALPKLNMYQSLHTTVVGPYGVRMEVQIRTEEMHRVAEFGIAAHWKYKEGKVFGAEDEKSFGWLRQLLEWQTDMKDSTEFMESVKVDLFGDEVFVFSPKGAIKHFPAGATPVDFAYAVHTDVGDHCASAKVNGKMVPLKTVLKNGDVVEIVTSQSHQPSKDWLKFVVSTKAKAKIRQWIKTEERAKSVTLGREILEKEFMRHGLDLARLTKGGEMERLARDAFGLTGLESLLASIGYGKVSALQVLGKLLPPEKLAEKDRQKFSFKSVFGRFTGAKPSRSPVIVRGEEDVLVKFGKCCSPLPGDEIAGFITHGHGVSIHSAGCQSLLNVDRDRMIEVAWDTRAKATRPIRIEVVCLNEKGLLAEMTNAIKKCDANIASAEIRTDTVRNKAICTFEVEAANVEHLKTIMKALSRIKKVTKVERAAKKEHHREGEQEGTA